MALLCTRVCVDNHLLQPIYFAQLLFSLLLAACTVTQQRCCLSQHLERTFCMVLPYTTIYFVAFCVLGLFCISPILLGILMWSYTFKVFLLHLVYIFNQRLTSSTLWHNFGMSRATICKQLLILILTMVVYSCLFGHYLVSLLMLILMSFLIVQAVHRLPLYLAQGFSVFVSYCPYIYRSCQRRIKMVVLGFLSHIILFDF